MGFAYYLQDNLPEAGRAYAEALALGQASGDIINILLASIRLGQIQETGNQLHLAAETYRRVLQRIDEYSPPNSPVAYLGLARICYEWNDLDTAGQYGEQSLQLAKQYDQVIDRLILSELFLSQLKLTRGDAVGADLILSQTEQIVRQKKYTVRLPDIAYAQAMVHLHQGNVDEAAQLARQYKLLLMQARVCIARGDPSAALAALEQRRDEAEARSLADRVLRLMAVQSIALYASGEKEKALDLLDEVLARAEPEGFIRLFLDEGPRMAELLATAAAQGIRSDYANKLLAAFPKSTEITPQPKITNQKSKMIEPLSERELEVLKLLRSELSGPEIAERLIVSLNTLRTHTKNIFNKLGVNNRRAAVRRAQELDLF
jgi:LuxR family maltose regulon positive regulatory protein